MADSGSGRRSVVESGIRAVVSRCRPTSSTLRSLASVVRGVTAVGFSTPPICEITTPSLASVEQPVEFVPLSRADGASWPA